MIRTNNKILLFACAVVFFSCYKQKQNDKIFFTAVTEKDYGKTKEYLENGYRLTGASENDPIIIAVNNNDTEMISLLLQNGSNPNAVYQGNSLLYWAIKENRGVIKPLIDNGADVNYKNDDGGSVFGRAIGFLPDEDLNIFIENGLDLMGRSKRNNEIIPYFEDLLISAKYKTAIRFLENKDVVEETINNPKIIFRLIQRWSADAEKIADKLVENGFELNQELPLLQYATASYGATLWLLDHDVSPIKEYLSPEASDFEKTPLDAAYFGLYMVTTWAQIDGSYVENTPDELERRRVIELLEKRIAEMSAASTD
jgi:hypothetical protein